MSMPPDDAQLLALAKRVGERLLGAGLRIVTAESCTAGWIAKALTDVAGSSRWLECGYVSYSNEAKLRDLRVSATLLARDGAVSEAVVRAMATGALRVSGAQVAIAVSGIAGPDGAQPGKPVGTVWFCVALAWGAGRAQCRHFSGDREAVRRRSVAHALEMLADQDFETQR
jgi:nicotinamide-nucleotide amidase